MKKETVVGSTFKKGFNEYPKWGDIVNELSMEEKEKLNEGNCYITIDEYDDPLSNYVTIDFLREETDKEYETRMDMARKFSEAGKVFREKQDKATFDRIKNEYEWAK